MRHPAGAAELLAWSAVAIVAYAAVAAVMLAGGGLVKLPSPAVGWLVRDVALAVAALSLGLLAAGAAHRSGDSRPADPWGPALAVVGAVSLLLGLVDHHVLGLFRPSGMATDVAFHGLASLVACVGLVRMRRAL